MKRNKQPRIRVVVLGLSLAGWLCAAPAAAQTWVELFPTGGPSGPIVAYQPAGGYDSANNRLIVYFATNPTVGDPPVEVWVLSNANGLGGPPAWTQLFPSGSPPFLHGHNGVAYDQLTNRLIVYGGCFAFCSPALANVHVLSNANGLGGPPVWTQSSVTNPQPRVDHSVVLDAVNNTLIAFGGHFAFFGTDQNDTRLLSNANGLVSPSTWSPLGTSGALPGIRDDHSAIYDATSNHMTIFAGTNLISTCCPYVQSDYNDVWVLTNANGQTGTPVWMQMFPAGGPPPPRSLHSAVHDSGNNRMIVFGGVQWVQAAQSGTFLGDLWALSDANGLGGTPTWTQLAPSGTPPGPNVGHAAAFDSASQRMILFGGANASAPNHTRVWVLIFNQDPTADAGADQSIECASPGSTPVTLDGSGSSDPDAGQTLTYTWTWSIGGQDFSEAGASPTITLPFGTHAITLTVDDGNGGTASDMVLVSVHVRVEGLLPPLAALVPEGDTASLPTHAFKQGRTLPLKLQLFCGATALTDFHVPAPHIVGLMRNGDALLLSTLDLDAGEANDSGTAFRYSASNWVYNLNTQGLSAGSYTITIELPDGRRGQAAFVLR